MNPSLRNIGLAVVLLGLPRIASAHRLDEYLQATRISIAAGRIDAEINLTPGAAVADDVFAAIDRDHSGEISKAEAASYARSFVESLSLDVDGQRHSLTLGSYSMPTLEDMRRGEGVIRLHAMAAIPAAPAGRHHLRFANTHRADIGVYLVNAFLPTDERIRINGQSRDMLQREFDMDYSISARENGFEMAAALPPILGLALAAAFFAVARRFREA